jgi:hypothetical protein
VAALALWALLALQEKPAAVKPALAIDGGRFRVTGTSPLPDGAVVALSLYYEAVEGRPALATHNVAVKAGAFAATLPLFKERAFPGRYVLLARVPPARQSPAVLTALAELEPAAHAEAAAGAAEEVPAARRAYLDELAAAFGRLDAIRAEILAYPKPGDAGWKERARGWVNRAAAEGAAFSGRTENVILRFGAPDIDGFGPSVEAIADLCGARAEGRRTELIVRFLERHRYGYLHRIGSTSDQLARAAVLFESVGTRLKAGGAADPDLARELLELGSLLPEQAQEAVQALVRRAAAAEGPPVEGLLAEIKPWIDELQRKP